MNRLGKRVGALLIAMILLIPVCGEAATCAMLKFNDNTRYDDTKSADILSDMIIERLLASGKFDLRETKPLSDAMIAKLYAENTHAYKDFENAVKDSNFNGIFESGYYNSEYAAIDVAEEGQFVSPDITKALGEKYRSKYLIQGTIMDLSRGGILNTDKYLTGMAGLYLSSHYGLVGDLLGGLFDLATGSSVKLQLGVTCNLRVIEAETGRVVWYRDVYSTDESKKFVGTVIETGNDKYDDSMYYAMLNKAADDIANALITDMEQHKLWLEE